MAEQKKQRKYGRNKRKPSHQRRMLLSENRTECNKVRREMKNLRQNPNDVACLSRLSTRESTGDIPVKMFSELKKFLSDFRAQHKQ